MHSRPRLLYTSLFAMVLAGIVSLIILLFVLAGKASGERKAITQRFDGLGELVTQNSVRIAANTDALMAYMQRTTMYLDKLQRDNPQIKVPKAAENRSPGAPPPTDKELERPKYEHPKADQPTPAPITKTVVKYKARAKPKPTPKPAFRWPWQSQSTR